MTTSYWVFISLIGLFFFFLFRGYFFKTKIENQQQLEQDIGKKENIIKSSVTEEEKVLIKSVIGERINIYAYMAESVGKTKAQAIKDILQDINTLEEYEEFERQYYALLSDKNLDIEVYDSGFLDILDKVSDKLDDKVLAWQFIPDLSIYTPKKQLENAYKVFSKEEYQEAKKYLSKSKYDWEPITGWESPEQIDSKMQSEIDFSIEFRIIVESDEPMQSQIIKINSLVAKKPTMLNELCSALEDEHLTFGDMWFMYNLEKDGLPFAYELYKDGYTTPEKCLEIDPNEFIKRKGVGKVKQEELKKYQAKVKRRKNKILSKNKKLGLIVLFNKILEDDIVTLEEAKELQQNISSSSINDRQIKHIELTLARVLIDDHLDEKEAEELRVLLGEYVDSENTKSKPKPQKPKKLKPKEPIKKENSNSASIYNPLFIGKEYYILYQDFEGNISERGIIVLSYTENKMGNLIVKSKCKKANAIRHFRLDRIIEAVDLETGEIIL
ncbi:hypothetical protein QJU74_04035 [Pasteurella atlantica]|uniref:hypothetical protein n=1 Tax=Phocoenobacter atlanticus TaxID=3416742 RepID=UPI001BC95AEF|nr:hypothetical protein [Pasteurella atlantica]MDP8160233.1 hypothetical protein [Pasteurella atlantica]QVE21648.1 hypothetical protein KGI96_04510 [Pasteurella atlantica]